MKPTYLVEHGAIAFGEYQIFASLQAARKAARIASMRSPDTWIWIYEQPTPDDKPRKVRRVITRTHESHETQTSYLTLDMDANR
jgi:hypothetical protein